MNSVRALKAALRRRMEATKTGSSLYFGYGKLRNMPAGVARSAAHMWHDTRDRLGYETDWEAPLEFQWRSILRRSALRLPDPSTASGPRVLFATSYGFNPFVTGLHSMLAVALWQRGARPEVLVCDKALPACDWNPYGNMQPAPGEFGPRLPRLLGLSRCRHCTSCLDSVYRLLDLPIRRLRAFRTLSTLDGLAALVESRTIEELGDLVYRGVPIGEHGHATAVRLLMRGTLDAQNPHHLWLLRRETLAAAVAVDLLSSVLDQQRPDCVVMQHGIYVTHGVLSDLARSKGIPVVVHEWADRKNTFIWSHGETTHRELIAEPNDAWEGLELTGDENRRLDEYLRSKHDSSGDWMCHYPNPKEDWAAITQEGGLTPDDPTVVLFTNTMWDAQLNYRGNAFPTMLEWVLFTLDYARGRPDLKFVIREHPGEARVWGRPGQRILDEVTRVTSTPGNVTWVLAESDISSYALAEAAQACVVYGTKLGLELAVQGRPVVVAGNAFIRGKGIAYDVESPGQYKVLLDQLPGLPQPGPDQVARARRYAYHYYFRRVVEIPLLTMENPAKGTKAKLRFRQIEDLACGRHRVLDQICEGILDGRSFVFSA